MMSAGVIASVFKPSDLSDLQAWYDASDSSTITSDSDGISQWADKSGNDYHGTQSTNNKKPSVSTSPDNGLPSVEFVLTGSVSTDILATTAPTWSFLDRTTFVVFAKKGTIRGCVYGHNYFRLKFNETGYGILLASSSTDTQFGDHSGEIYGMGGPSGGDPANMAAVDSTTADDTDVLICQQYKTGSSSYCFVQKNAEDKEDMTATMTAQLNGTDSADSQAKSSVGFIGGKAMIGGHTITFIHNSAQTPTPAPSFHGHIQEICEYNRLLSDQERNQVMGYLLGKWRVT